MIALLLLLAPDAQALDPCSQTRVTFLTRGESQVVRVGGRDRTLERRVDGLEGVFSIDVPGVKMGSAGAGVAVTWLLDDATTVTVTSSDAAKPFTRTQRSDGQTDLATTYRLNAPLDEDAVQALARSPAQSVSFTLFDQDHTVPLSAREARALQLDFACFANFGPEEGPDAD